jgi:hypothetical protein
MLARTPRNHRWLLMLPAISLRLGRWLKSRAERFELERVGADEVQRLAKDLGLAPAELRLLVSRGSQEADLLHRRLALLRLDPKALAAREPLLFRDLQRLCALCDRRGRCVRDLARADVRDPADSASADWQDYCPNAATLKMLSTLQSCSEGGGHGESECIGTS